VAEGRRQDEEFDAKRFCDICFALRLFMFDLEAHWLSVSTPDQSHLSKPGGTPLVGGARSFSRKGAESTWGWLALQGK
jgi:hypothetical protein